MPRPALRYRELDKGGDEAPVCCICLEPLDQELVVELPCGHAFHAAPVWWKNVIRSLRCCGRNETCAGLEHWFNKQEQRGELPSCPLCRAAA